MRQLPKDASPAEVVINNGEATGMKRFAVLLVVICILFSVAYAEALTIEEALEMEDIEFLEAFFGADLDQWATQATSEELTQYKYLGPKLSSAMLTIADLAAKTLVDRGEGALSRADRPPHITFERFCLLSGKDYSNPAAKVTSSGLQLHLWTLYGDVEECVNTLTLNVALSQGTSQEEAIVMCRGGVPLPDLRFLTNDQLLELQQALLVEIGTRITE